MLHVEFIDYANFFYAEITHNTRLEMKRTKRDDICLLMKFDLTLAHFSSHYENTSKIPVRWPGQCYGFTLSLIFKYCVVALDHWIILEYV